MMKALMSFLPGYSIIACPFCAEEKPDACCDPGEYLHLDQMEILSRKEDKGGILTIVSATDGKRSERIVSDDEAFRIFDTRRDGMILTFNCETCDNRPKLRIFQRKGHTVMGWVES